MTDTTGALGAAEEWRLRDEREFLVRSLDDARREHEAGDLNDADYDLLRRRDEQRLAEVDAALAKVAATAVELGAAGDGAAVTAPGNTRGGRRPAPRQPPPRRPDASAWPTLATTGDEADADGPAASDRAGQKSPSPRRRRPWLALIGVAFLVAGAVLLVLDVTSPRQPGGDLSGTTGVSPVAHNEVRRQLADAAIAAKNGTDTQALQLYGEVISEEPRNAQALAAWGWLDWRAALNSTASKITTTIAAEGQSAVARALQLDRSLYPAQFYLGDIYYQEHKYAQAVTHLAAFLALKPPPSWLDNAAPVIRSAYTLDGKTVPAGVPATTAGTQTTVPSTSTGGATSTTTAPAGS